MGTTARLTVPLLIFDVAGHLAHFRRPDTAVTHATYPFPTRTALRGMLGAILGRPEWVDTEHEAWTGVRILNPIRTRAQELSMLGKGWFGNGDAFNRPTAIELVVEPAYRIYYTGPDGQELAERIRQRRSHFPTYLGSAYALTVPRFIAWEEAEEVGGEAAVAGGAVNVAPEGPLESPAVVPTHAVLDVEPVPGRVYARVGGVLHTHLGGRRFRRSLSFLYEPNGQAIRFWPAPGPYDPPVRWVRCSDGLVCLW
ncbi:CRISPR-associated protein Cas5 [Thermaerobacter marianensis DSM 12885]|uniref:CRISPR-associated protein Cas5 n=1 Tax=Thermaerobacter marianensis (strain ATCC 700841 / DSM 12885 / JCM 10246 / 7p75a) TaxID=644966 RepID=E6SGT8_THEM7|nr:CRISPR-associated protein Cas5 [Thermaerobacter marianensis]ADU51672.1 CRISPR-associated protein Cas5 [Thermaerobacter marianensis DSM 12885]